MPASFPRRTIRCSLTRSTPTISSTFRATRPRSPSITTKDEGAALARALGRGFAVLIGNHGVTFCGTTIEHAVCVGIFLEKACKAQVVGHGAGIRPACRTAPCARSATGQIMTPVALGAFLELFLPQARERAGAAGDRRRPFSADAESASMSTRNGRSERTVRRQAVAPARGCRGSFRARAGIVDDVALPGTLWCAFVRSPHAHARIRGISTEAAARCPACC